jgi:ABC-type nickel/cobalt efflux system permease component RcnA
VTSVDSVRGAVPGGVAGELPDLFQATTLTPIALLLAIVVAAGLGAWHALTPGHGKTLMAAYLVGTRGTPIHAVGLGLSVAVSHTMGIVALALLIVGAQSVLAPDVVVRTTPIVAAMSIVVIGGWMLIGEARRRRAVRETHDHVHEHDHGVAGEHGDDSPDAHSHGGVRHSHLPPGGSNLSWRGLFVLGLAGGLIPSTSALLILLGSMAAGRPAFGLVLVVAFGLGMAAVMTGVGLAMVFARGRLDRVPRGSTLGRLAGAAPLLASVAVLSLGVVLTWSAVAGRPVL